MEHKSPLNIRELVEAVTSLRAAYVPYAHLERTKEKIDIVMMRNNGASEGAVYSLIGPTRSGKSHFLRHLEEEYPRERLHGGDQDGDYADSVPLLVVKVPDATKKSLAIAIFKALTHLEPEKILGSRFTADKVREEIVRVARACNLRLLVLDEAHQAIDSKSDRVAAEVGVFIKDLANEGRFSLLVAGTENATRLIKSNEELEGRGHKRLDLHPFQRRPADLEVWNEILEFWDGYLAKKVFGRQSGLSEPQMAEALMTASVGLIGHAATLVENAALEAVQDMMEGEPQACIRWRHLESAFAEWMPGRRRVNPFAPGSMPPQEGSPMLPDEPAGAPPVTEPVMSGARGRQRRNHRDQRFHK